MRVTIWRMARISSHLDDDPLSPSALMLPRTALLLAAITFIAPARAHDPYESWTAVALRATGLELNITMAQSTALRLIDPEAAIRGLTLENFPTYRPRF